MDICVGDVFESKSSGNRYRVMRLTLGHKGETGKVYVLRLGPRPKWDDGYYAFVPEQFSETGDLRLIACA